MSSYCASSSFLMEQPQIQLMIKIMDFKTPKEVSQCHFVYRQDILREANHPTNSSPVAPPANRDIHDSSFDLESLRFLLTMNPTLLSEQALSQLGHPMPHSNIFVYVEILNCSLK